MKRPAFQFYPGDWQRNAALRSCSVGARGLWIEMMCIMHEGQPYGHLAVNGAGIGPAQLARMVGASARQATSWLEELRAAAVYSVDDAGRIFSRRMVKDERLRNVRAEAGKLGGNPALLNSKDKQSGGDKVKGEVIHTLNLVPTPAVAFASASSKPPPTPPSRKSRRLASGCPDEFDVSDAMAQWAVSVGVPAEQLEPQTGKFLDHHRSKGSTFSDWSAAWRTWMRNSVEFSQRRAAH